ncbi:MAG: HAD family phosphatase [Dysgonamonadaceae bacterium]|jgi:2-haloacid dehalogenase|nr:HAD family phosphatase [Dysgonamonadaceae bacterium]MDD3355756.1 HAD family phosphatase [Dysgonamonadaceae bacterium]MDD4246408.1 HAD family phosphatase [Dysgonamonadaceae bacterium]MDD4605210.1 HAD family phosphatase [Dysgonamonadaceae bacterium]
MTEIKNIVFDFGGVLVDWNPTYLYSKLFDNETEMNHFLENICTPEWNIRQDAGRPLVKATELLQAKHPEYKELIGHYYGRWDEMLGGDIKENVRVLEMLRPKYTLFGLTNWSAETITIAYNKYDFFKHFDGIVVSGDENIVKPDPKLYQVLLNRYNLKANESLFIDDNLKNIEIAREMGFHTIHFTENVDLEKEVRDRGLL